MKTAIRYYTQTGNTKKLAEAIAIELGIEAKSVEKPLEEKTEILFLCNSVYWAGVDKHVKQFVKVNAGKIGTLVNVSTAAMIESSYNQMKRIAEEVGVNISENEFHCRGKFAALHSKHPDEEDISAVKKFAKKVAG